MLTPADIKSPALKAGYKHVNVFKNGTYRAQAYGGTRTRAGHSWYGPVRKTARQAAQDYCNHINSGRGALPASNKSAGHQRPQQPKRQVPSDIQAARGMIRDWEAQQKKGIQGYVYMIIEDNPGGGLGYCKIGYSVNPEKRVTELQTANPRPLRLLYKMKGTEADERRLHRKYHSINVLAEWFNLNSGLGRALLLEFPASAYIKPEGVTIST